MSFRDFTFPEVCTDLGLTLHELNLFREVAPVELPADLRRTLDRGRTLSQGLHNEKARSEFLIAPLLLRIWGDSEERFGLFSGTELNVDPEHGLNGVCDFLLARDPLVYVLRGPILAVAEAKNDNVRNGFGQCIATMFAAAAHNTKCGTPSDPVYGASTTGVAWKFFRLDGTDLTLDRDDYFFTDLGSVAAILFRIAGVSPVPWPELPITRKASS